MDNFPALGGRRIRAGYDKILHPDIISQVLERLPVKSLARFKCVSKDWLALIESERFIKQFIVRQQAGLGVLISWRYSDQLNKGVIKFRYPHSVRFDAACSDIKIPFLDNHLLSSPEKLKIFIDGTKLVGSCDGLVGFVFEGNVGLCNPSLMEYKELPFCKFNPGNDLDGEDPFPEDRYDFILMSEGLGRASTGEYKMVLIWQVQDNYMNKVFMTGYIYNLSTISSTWVEINPRPYIVPSESSSAVFLNGTCYWHSYEDTFSESEIKILSLDLSKEVFIELNYPDTCSTDSPYLLVYNQSHLAFVQVNVHEQVELWVREDYGDDESWARHSVVGPYLPIQPMVIWDTGSCLLAKKKEGDGELVSCSLQETQLKTFDIFLNKEVIRVVTYEDATSVSLAELIKSVELIKLC